MNKKGYDEDLIAVAILGLAAAFMTAVLLTSKRERNGFFDNPYDEWYER